VGLTALASKKVGLADTSHEPRIARVAAIPSSATRPSSARYLYGT